MLLDRIVFPEAALVISTPISLYPILQATRVLPLEARVTPLPSKPPIIISSTVLPLLPASKSSPGPMTGCVLDGSSVTCVALPPEEDAVEDHGFGDLRQGGERIDDPEPKRRALEVDGVGLGRAVRGVGIDRIDGPAQRGVGVSARPSGQQGAGTVAAADDREGRGHTAIFEKFKPWFGGAQLRSAGRGRR